MSRTAFRIARELTSNSRSGLTVRFLSKKLDVPEEEIEYLLDVNHRLLFTDLTKVKVVPEGHSAVKRISEGLENRGDVESLMRLIKGLDPHEFRRLEELLDIDQPVTKKSAAETLLEQHYRHPDSVVSYVATRGFSARAKEVFDIVWQSKRGIMPISQIRVAHGGSEFDVEQALWELFRGFALFEMYRFDPEDRLVRVAGVLSEIRQYRESLEDGHGKRGRVKPVKAAPTSVQGRGLDLSDRICRLVAALAARPARLRGDGDLFREDRRRLAEIVPEEADPSLSTCLWAGQGVGWITRVDNELRVGELEDIIRLDRVSRHKILYDWFATHGDDSASRKRMASMIEDMKPGAWYSSIEFVRCALDRSEEEEAPTLKQVGGHWHFASPAATGQMENRLARSLEETFFWLGAVERATVEGDSLFRVSPLGEALLTGGAIEPFKKDFPPRKCEFVVQPNFDIVVPTEDMDPLLTVPLDQFAVRGSTGQATVYHVSKDSFTQALQEGHDGDAFVDFLVRHNRNDALPLNVMTTLEDWRGGIKRVRLRTIHIIESDDPLIIADIMHRRKFKRVVAPIDPKKALVYQKIPKDELTKELEKDGFVVE